MSDLTITPPNVIASDQAKIQIGTAGVAITAGQVLYGDAADIDARRLMPRLKLADANVSSDTAYVVGIALNDASPGQPIFYVTEDDDFTPGATLTVGMIYVLSSTAGGIAPRTDLGAGHFPVTLFVATSATKAVMRIVRGSVAIKLYVDSVLGDDANNGFSTATPKLTLTDAVTTLIADGNKGTIYVTAPSSDPVNGFIDFDSGEITIEGLDSVEWYSEDTTTWTSGWTADGGGIYHRANGSADADLMFVPTMTDADDFELFLLKNVSTPTAPDAGEFGVDVTNFYVHLVGDEDPDNHTIKIHNTDYLFRASGTAALTIKDCVARYTGANGCFECTAAGAVITLKNSTGIYSASTGVSLPSGAGEVICTNCNMQRHTNDGYNQNDGVLTLTDCDASYNLDEGISTQDGAMLTVTGGRSHHNQSAGYSAVGSDTEMVLTNVLADFNGAKDEPGVERNGIVFDTGTIGSITDSISRNNTGCGLYCNGGTVTITNLISGLGEGNTLADVEC